jgi:superfamily II DNA/RNA helicase
VTAGKPLPVVPWADLPLPTTVRAGIGDGWPGPRPFQVEVARGVLGGEDLVLRAPTGSGKTLAYGWPLLSACLEGPPGLRALVVVPTRELAVQVTRALRESLGAPRPVISAAYGGVDARNQSRALARGVDLLVATPGRLRDLLARRHLDLTAVRAWVVDEADELWNGGFRDDLLAIHRALPRDVRTIWVSATADPERPGQLPPWWQTCPRIVGPGTSEQVSAPVPEPIRHLWVQVQPDRRRGILLGILQRENGQAFVFVNQRDEAAPLARWLRRQGLPTAYLTARSTQAERQEALEGFRLGDDRILVATDLASRGLDVLAARTVVNYEVPLDRTHYWHRAGRTGRAGMDGRVYTLSAPAEVEAMRRLRAEVPFETVRIRPAAEQAPGFRPGSRTGERGGERLRRTDAPGPQPPRRPRRER